MSKSNKPAAERRFRNIKAVIWRNDKTDGEGFWYSTEFIRTYKDENDDYQDAHTFSGDQNLVLARLATWAFERTSQLEQEDYANQQRSAA